MYDELFYQRLTALRQQKGVSARDMSLSLGQNAGYINNIENRHNLPSMTVFFDICEYLKISPKDFFDFDTPMPEEIKILIDSSRKMNSEELTHLTAIAEALSQKK